MYKTLDDVAFNGEVDGDITNEIQNLSFNSSTNELSLTNSSHVIDLSSLNQPAYWSRDPAEKLYPSTISDKIGIGLNSPETHLHVYASNAKIRLESSSIGQLSLSKDMHGLELISSGMNYYEKYGSAIKFMSTDPQFTTESPKFLAGIIPRADEDYNSDNDGGMAIDRNIFIQGQIVARCKNDVAVLMLG